MIATDEEIKTIINKFEPEVLSTREMETVLERYLFDHGNGEITIDAFKKSGFSGAFPQHTFFTLIQAYNDASAYYFKKFRKQK